MRDPIENRKGRMVGERSAARSLPAAVVVEPGALRVRVSGVRGLCFPGAPLSCGPRNAGGWVRRRTGGGGGSADGGGKAARERNTSVSARWSVGR
jgi:hypothetical protein